MVTLKFDGKTYELTYTRETVRTMERNGFDFQAFLNGKQPANYGFMLFTGAFASKHRKLPRKTMEAIWDHLEDKTKLTVALAEMYSATLDTLVDAAAVEDDGKKVSWEME